MGSHYHLDGALIQEVGNGCYFVGASLVQETGAVSHILTGSACTQANLSSTGPVSQSHVLTGSACTQVNQSSTGAISVTWASIFFDKNNNPVNFFDKNNNPVVFGTL